MMSGENRICGQTAVITGAHGDIGRRLCARLAAEGVNLYACIRESDSSFEAEMKKLESVYSIWVKLIQMDQEETVSVDKGISEILKDKANIDILFHCTGVTATALLNETSVEEIKRVYQINYFSLLQITKLLSKRMIRARHGNIISIASYAGIENRPGRLAYGGSKNAIMYATRTLANEYKAFGIRVNAVAPGPIDTRMLDHYSQDEMDAFISASYNKRLGTPDDVVNLLLFLASDASAHINGQIIRLDGGM